MGFRLSSLGRRSEGDALWKDRDVGREGERENVKVKYRNVFAFGEPIIQDTVEDTVSRKKGDGNRNKNKNNSLE
jgi:hypothetical protein